MLEINESSHVKSTQFFSHSGVFYLLRRCKVVRIWRGVGGGGGGERNDGKAFRFSPPLPSSTYSIFYNSFFTATEPHSGWHPTWFQQLKKLSWTTEAMEDQLLFLFVSQAKFGPTWPQVLVPVPRHFFHGHLIQRLWECDAQIILSKCFSPAICIISWTDEEYNHLSFVDLVLSRFLGHTLSIQHDIVHNWFSIWYRVRSWTNV